MNKQLNNFKQYLQTERRYSPETIIAYLYDLKQFIANLDGNEVTEAGVDTYLESLYRTYKSSTVLRKQSVITQFLSYLFHEGTLSFEYVSDHHSRRPVRLPKPLSTTHISQLLEAPHTTLDRFYLRDKLLFQWLYGYGARVSELTSVTVSQCGNAFIELIGKGQKTRRMARHQSEQALCNRYCTQLRHHLLRNRTQTPHLFISSQGKPLTRFGIYAIVQKYANRCQLTAVFPHQFRHSFATHLLEGGADLNAVQTLMGHASIQTTQGYMSISDRHKHHIFKQTHPRSGQ